MKNLAAIFVLLALGFPAGAQEEAATGGDSFGVIVFADGDVVSIVRDGRRLDYDVYTGELLGFPLYSGDTIQTDAQTYLQIQLLPSLTIVKVAENTSFKVERFGANGEGVFDLAYGRLRACITRLAGTDPFMIRGIGAVATVRGTDFGTDVVIGRTGGPAVTRIYCFDGEVEVTVEGPAAPADEGSTPDEPAPIIVRANQMVTASAPTPAPQPESDPDSDPETPAEPSVPRIGEVQTIRQDVREYWQREMFVQEPREPELIFQDYPSLEDQVTGRLGSIPFLEPDPVSGQDQEPDAIPGPPVETLAEGSWVDEPTVEGEGAAAESMDPERLRRLTTVTKVTGYSALALGTLAEAAATTLFFLGESIFPDWPAAADSDLPLYIGAAGGVVLIGGVLSLLYSIQLAR